MIHTTEEAKAEFIEAKTRFMKVYDATPKDQLDCSPAATARTPREILFHVASALGAFTSALKGEGMGIEAGADIDALLRAADKNCPNEEGCRKLLEENSSTYLGWLDSVSDADLQKIVDTPFMALPAHVMCSIQASHLSYHGGQVAYLQTVHGDRNWYQ